MLNASAFKRRCLYGIGRVWWTSFPSNDGSVIGRDIVPSWFSWFGRVLHMPTKPLLRSMLFFRASGIRVASRGGQPMIWQKSVKKLPSGPARIGAVRLPGWDPGYPSQRCLGTTVAIHQWYSQWRRCAWHPSSSSCYLAIDLSLFLLIFLRRRYWGGYRRQGTLAQC